MQQRAKEALEALLVKVSELFGLKLHIKLSFDLKGTCTIGQCKKLKNLYHIRLHDRLLNQYRQIYLDDVLTHEVAHAVQMEIYDYKVMPHGKEWRLIMSKLENSPYNPKKRPKYEMLQKQRKRFSYTCECKTLHLLSQTRHNRIKKGTRYMCKKCKGFLSEKV